MFHFYFFPKIEVESQYLKKQKGANFGLSSFSAPREEIGDVAVPESPTDPSSARRKPQKATKTSAGNIRHPELQNEPKKLQLRNYKGARTSGVFHFHNFFMKNISRDNAIQNAICCKLCVIFSSAPREEIGEVAVPELPSEPSSARRKPQKATKTSAGNIYHPELQNEIEKLQLRTYKRARNPEMFHFFNFSSKKEVERT